MKYHISVNGQTMGPFEPEQLVNQCGLTMNSYVWNETMTGWQLASTVRELVDLLNAKRQSQPVKYCMFINGQTVGPYVPEQLMSQYGLNMNSYVWNETIPNWQLAGSIPELAALIASRQRSQQTNQYFISVNGQTVGPFEPSQLINQYGLNLNSYVWNETMTGWQLASTVPELVSLLKFQSPNQQIGSEAMSDDESDEELKYMANFWTKGDKKGNAQGGRIRITPTQLIFHPHALNWGKRVDRIFEIREITGFEKEAFTLLRIFFSDGSKILLTVSANKRNTIIQKLVERHNILCGSEEKIDISSISGSKFKQVIDVIDGFS